VGPGQCFGELALLHSEGRAANVMALEDSKVRGPPGGWPGCGKRARLRARLGRAAAPLTDIFPV
jgi:hypothetical protein